MELARVTPPFLPTKIDPPEVKVLLSNEVGVEVAIPTNPLLPIIDRAGRVVVAVPATVVVEK